MRDIWLWDRVPLCRQIEADLRLLMQFGSVIKGKLDIWHHSVRSMLDRLKAELIVQKNNLKINSELYVVVNNAAASPHFGPILSAEDSH